MKTPRGDIWFLASCVELYKKEKNMTGRDAYEYLQQHGAVDYIARNWEGLHMTSPDYIIDSVDEFIDTHNV
jgi:hypothetical protein